MFGRGVAAVETCMSDHALADAVQATRPVVAVVKAVQSVLQSQGKLVIVVMI